MSASDDDAPGQCRAGGAGPGEVRDAIPPEQLIAAYAQGIFPMADPDGSIGWYRPTHRAILPLDGLRIPRSLRRTVRRGTFEITSDQAFPEVVRACAQRPAAVGSWIDDRFVAGYARLQRLGHAHSVEAWRRGRLVGGLYGVHLGSAFFGESMFVRPEEGGTDASKVCLVHLVAHLRARGFTLLDSQIMNDHMAQFGVIEITHARFVRRLRAALDRSAAWSPFVPADPDAVTP